MLTKRQKDLLTVLDREIKRTGVTPSYNEMKDALGLASKSGVYRLVRALDERGFIRRLPGRARAIEVVRLPTEVSSHAAPPVAANDSVEVPLRGRIAAGVPVDAIEQQGEAFVVPNNMLGHGEHFALEIEGESMKDAGILDGDVVIVRQAGTALDNDIVVALVDREEATLKRLRKSGEQVELISENPDFETRVFGPDRVEVQGILVGLVRRYH